ncbi:hypothetical protein E2C01_037038 [Portunus trituberculatus]|uniref:Uncharacterized protein n=1 Tax=Portunus trituberculatus TaxID=210409 RepID=A0A5B7FE92_PORTR|nr:hypothetical protein [Portunus trituberculatus]
MYFELKHEACVFRGDNGGSREAPRPAPTSQPPRQPRPAPGTLHTRHSHNHRYMNHTNAQILHKTHENSEAKRIIQGTSGRKGPGERRARRQRP